MHHSHDDDDNYVHLRLMKPCTLETIGHRGIIRVDISVRANIRMNWVMIYKGLTDLATADSHRSIIQCSESQSALHGS